MLNCMVKYRQSEENMLQVILAVVPVSAAGFFAVVVRKLNLIGDDFADGLAKLKSVAES